MTIKSDRLNTIAVWVGMLASAGLTLWTGRRNSSWILPTLFVVWVMAPFLGLVWANRVSKGWAAVRVLTWALALLSPAIYGYIALGPRRAQPASAFLMVPLASWMLIVVVVALARRRLR